MTGVYNEEVLVWCEEGFYQNGTNKTFPITCVDSGVWEGMAACEGMGITW